MAAQKGFNPYQIAVSSIEKAISERKEKLKEQAEAESISTNDALRADLFFQLGRAESKCELYSGEKLKEAKSQLADLRRKAKLIDDAWSEKKTKLIFKWEEEIEELEMALRQVNRLFRDHQDKLELFSHRKG
uniref:Uncharacterized protein n=1 Tax=Enterovibrio sp. FF_113 TaxID=1660266 RepID=A0A0H3ZY67_9GAMM|nr:hypothetical protein [Enterovibrio sp. FF_113]